MEVRTDLFGRRSRFDQDARGGELPATVILPHALAHRDLISIAKHALKASECARYCDPENRQRVWQGPRRARASLPGAAASLLRALLETIARSRAPKDRCDPHTGCSWNVAAGRKNPH